MKQLALLSLSWMLMLPLRSPATMHKINDPGKYLTFNNNGNLPADIGNQADEGSSKMPAVVFRKQEFCRAELKDFEFNAQFKVVNATVYFMGTNFKSPEKVVITSNSLKPLTAQMQRCAPGTIVIFDDVKVVGPDKEVRPIQGTTITLF